MESEIDPHVFYEAIRDDDGTIVDLRFTEANAAAAEYLGRSRGELLGAVLSHVGTPAFALFLEALTPVIDSGTAFARDEWAMSTIHGQGRFVEVRAVKVGDGASVMWRDVTANVLARQALAESEERFRLLSVNASEMIVLLRHDRVAWASPSALAFLGTDAEQVLGMDLRTVITPEDVPLFDEAYAAADAGETRLVRLRAVAFDGTLHWVEVHAGPYVNAIDEHRGVLTSTRVIDDLISVEEELDHRARFDLLTGLMNRGEALATVTRLSTQHPRTGGLTALLFCDIDRFKEINDTYGHAAGDEVLRRLGERLTDAIRADDFAARIGGDELLVMLTGVHSLDEAVEVAEKIRLAATEPITLDDGTRIEPGLSVGVTLARAGESTDSLVERADTAMYEAKSTGRNRVIAIPAPDSVA